jgi:hypothetical protein
VNDGVGGCECIIVSLTVVFVSTIGFGATATFGSGALKA